MHCSVVASPFLLWSRVPDLNSAESGAHAHDLIFDLLQTKCLLATFATENLVCCPVGTEDRNWLQMFI